MTTEDHEIHHTVSRNVLVSIMATVLFLVTRLFIPPLILSFVSLEEYGIWSYCFIFISYLGLSVIGVTNVYVRYGAVFFAEGSVEKVNRLLSTGLYTVTALCLVLLPFFWYLLPWLFPVMNIPPHLYQTAFVLIFGTIVSFMLDLTVGAFGYLLQSLQKIVRERLITTASYLTETVLIIVFLYNGFGIYSLLWAYFLRTLLAVSLHIYSCYTLIPGLSIHPRYFDRSMFHLFYHFGAIVQLSGILGIVNRSIEKVIAGSFLGVQATALYEVGEKFPMMSQSIPSSVNSVLLPTTAHLHAKNKHDAIVGMYVKGSRFINIMTGLMMGFMAAFSLPLITAWLGPDEKYRVAATILTFFTIAYQMDVLTGPASAIYRSINQPKKELLYGGCQLILVFLAIVVGFALFEPSIMVINWAVAGMMVVSALLYIYYSNQQFGVPDSQYIRKVLLPGLYPYAFGALGWWIASPWFAGVSHDRWGSLWLFLAALGVYLAVMIPFMLFAVLSSSERQALRAAFRRLLG